MYPNIQWLILSVILLAGCVPSTDADNAAKHSGQCPPNSFAALKAYLRYDPARSSPLIMAHRGGPSAGFPENSIPAFERTLAAVDCPLMEFDVRMTLDSQLVLLHDDELELCTNGSGLLSHTNWADLRELHLQDEEDQLTDLTIPTFAEVLQWYTGRAAILIIDAKPLTDIDLVLETINRSQVKHQSVLICYSLADAEYVYAHTPDLMLALGFNNEALIAAIERSPIPKDQILALTPRELQPAGYYQYIHDLGISCSLGTNGNIDTLAISSSQTLYKERFRTGADIICTDKPVEVAAVFQSLPAGQ